jgi:N6-L-threonylcarbamoyladenine synthase
MRREDIPAVLDIEEGSFASPWSEGVFAEEVAREADRCWIVAEQGSDLLGYAGLMQVGEEGHVLNLAVRRDHRHEGLGAALLSHLMDEAVARGMKRLTLEVGEGNAAALALYEHAGFERAGRRPGYYSESREDAIVMWSGDLTDVEGEATRAALRESGEVALAGAGGSRTLVLAIETSCDETAAAVVADGRDVLSSVVASQVDFHSRFGGVVPEIASRKHIEAVVGVVDEALELAGLTLAEIDALAVTKGPGLIGALVVGVAYAKGLAMATGFPLVGVNHLEGHIYANVLTDPTLGPPFVALVVSGGHTSLVHVGAWGSYETLGATLDDAVGEAFDKVAKVLGLGYPGGPIISRLAAEGDPGAVDFPRAMIDSGDYSFSLSGLKTAVVTYVRREQEAGREVDHADVAASFQRAVVDVQVAKAVRAVREHGVSDFCLAGGVAANPELRDALSQAMDAEGVRVHVPPVAECTDNAAMIGAAAHPRLLAGERMDLAGDAVADLAL